MPIPDFRTVANVHVSRPSPDLLETVYLCQQRQDWYREFALSMHEPTLDFVGSASLEDDIVEVAATVRHVLGFDVEERRGLATWTDALRHFIGQADALGVLVMASGVVGSNNRRRLETREFRGFALADPLAPLIFINAADTKAAQMFTLAHELAHLWLGQSAVSDTEARGCTGSGSGALVQPSRGRVAGAACRAAQRASTLVPICRTSSDVLRDTSRSALW